MRQIFLVPHYDPFSLNCSITAWLRAVHVDVATRDVESLQKYVLAHFHICNLKIEEAEVFAADSENGNVTTVNIAFFCATNYEHILAHFLRLRADFKLNKNSNFYIPFVFDNISEVAINAQLSNNLLLIEQKIVDVNMIEWEEFQSELISITLQNAQHIEQERLRIFTIQSLIQRGLNCSLVVDLSHCVQCC